MSEAASSFIGLIRQFKNGAAQSLRQWCARCRHVRRMTLCGEVKGYAIYQCCTCGLKVGDARQGTRD